MDSCGGKKLKQHHIAHFFFIAVLRMLLHVSFSFFFFHSAWIACFYGDCSSSTCVWYSYSYLLTAWCMWPTCFYSWVMCSQPDCSFSFKHCLLCVYFKLLHVSIRQWPLLEIHDHSIVATSFLWRLCHCHWRWIFQPAHGNTALHRIPVLFTLTRS